MLKKDFWYDLPKELIAQEPADPRDSARLMVLSQKDDSIQHRIFRDLPEYLEPGDLLVVNNSKVLPARIVGVKQPTGAVCELLLLRQVKGDQWECLAKPGKRMQPGTKVSFGDGTLTAVVDETLEDGNKFVTFYYDTETLYEKLDEFGKMPLPPYITKQLEDQSQYQTVYAKELGSAAAPTAGLHFTPELMDTIRSKGVGIAEVTLHVGLGTFRPVQEDEITDHKMHSEWYSISEETAQRIRETKAAGHRVIAVGTTSCRTLEAAAAKYGEIKACSGNTSIFLYPGVKFNCIDGLITNPIVNSYKRLVPGYEAPTELTWTKNNQNSLVRIPGSRGMETRIELRSPDAAANPYLVFAVCLAAGLDGINKKIYPTKSSSRELSETDQKTMKIENLPGNLNEAIDYFEQSDWIKEVLGTEFCKEYAAAKKKEWLRYTREISAWEIEEYLYRI